MLQERNEQEAQRQAKELSRLNLDRAAANQNVGSGSPSSKIALDARSRPPVTSADDLDGHISDGSD